MARPRRQPEPAMPTPVLTLAQTAALLKVHPSTIYRLINKGQIPAFRICKDWQFNRESIERWIKERSP